jgi:hypothetical protein
MVHRSLVLASSKPSRLPFEEPGGVIEKIAINDTDGSIAYRTSGPWQPLRPLRS